MMRADAFNLHIYPVRKKITATQHIPILHVFNLDGSKSKGIIVEKNLSKVCFTDKRESESFIVNERSMEERKFESVHKNIKTKR